MHRAVVLVRPRLGEGVRPGVTLLQRPRVELHRGLGGGDRVRHAVVVGPLDGLADLDDELLPVAELVAHDVDLVVGLGGSGGLCLGGGHGRLSRARGLLRAGRRGTGDRAQQPEAEYGRQRRTEPGDQQTPVPGGRPAPPLSGLVALVASFHFCSLRLGGVQRPGSAVTSRLVTASTTRTSPVSTATE